MEMIYNINMNEKVPNRNNSESRENMEGLDLSFIIADDEEQIRNLLGDVLKIKYPAAKIEEVENGLLLVERLKIPGQNINFVITDNSMQVRGGDGIDAIRRIRGELGLKIPIIMLTGDLGEKFEFLKIEIESLGGICLQKPVGLKDIYRAIEKLRLESQK
jgi:CheY-like chemotaxis protein